MDRRQALCQDTGLPMKAFGSVLLADISGFTPLTIALANDFGQQRGAELLTRHLNQLFTQLIAQIHDYRGSVIGFSGDGMTCWFPDDSGLRAATVALAIQDIAARSGTIASAAGKNYPLGIKVAVTAGEVSRFLVGNPAIRYIEAMGGRELDRVAACEQAITSGEVAIGEEVVEALQDAAVIRATRAAQNGETFIILDDLKRRAEIDPWPTLPALDPDKARGWSLPHVQSRLLEGQSDFMTEFRQAVPLFFRFSGLDFAADGLAGEKLDVLVREFQGIMQKYGGMLNDLTIGDKGSYITGIFGAPLAQEDDATRGTMAALDIMDQLAALDFVETAQIGMTIGRIRAGTFGGELQLTYGVQGTEVNLAARLMAAASPQQILASPKVAKAAVGMDFEVLEPIQLKGLDSPMQPHQVLGRNLTRRIQPRTAIYGREAELELIRRKLDQHDPESRTNVIIQGEAGIGKSRLIAELLAESRARGYLTLHSEGDSVERTTPYYGLRPILTGVLNLSIGADPDTLQGEVMERIADDAFLQERAPLLNDILPIDFAENHLTQQMSGEARSLSVRDVVLRLFERIWSWRQSEDHALVLVFDDGQWIDTPTWQLIGQISQQVPGLFLVVGTRPVDSEPVGQQLQRELERLTAQPKAAFINLQNLSRAESSALAAKVLGVPQLPSSIQEMIHSRSQGNPFLSAEIAYTLRDTGAMRIAGDQVVANPDASDLKSIDFPDTLHGIILSRVDRLKPEYQLTLKVASILGTNFLSRTLTAIYPLEAPDQALESNLDSLAALDITPLIRLEPERSHAFRHVLMQEVIYNLMTFDQRRQLHHSAAEWYEQVYSHDLGEHYARLAHHWARAERRDKAIHYLDLAADQAIDLYSNWEALRLLNTAHELMAADEPEIESPDELIDHARRERRLGLVSFRLGNLQDCRRHYSKAMALLGQPVPKTRLGSIYAVLRELARQVQHRFSRPGKVLNVELAEDPRMIELLNVELGEVFFYSQEIDRMAWDLVRRLNLAEQLGMAREKAHGYSNLLLVTGFLPFQRLIKRYHDLTNQAVEEANSAAVEVYARLRISVTQLQACQWELGRENNEAALKIADRIGDARQWEENAATLATSYFLRGCYPEALELWKDQFRRATRNEVLQGKAWSFYGQGQIYLYLGETEKALELLEASLAVPTGELIDKILQASRAGAYALALTRSGHYARALQSLTDHIDITPGPPPSTGQINEFVSLLQAGIALERKVRHGDFVPDERQALQLEAALSHTGLIADKLRKHTQVNAASAWLYWGCHQQRLGKQAVAEKAWQSAMEKGQQNGQAYEVARAHYELGLYGSASADTRRDHLETAVQLFVAIQASYDVRRTQEALQALRIASRG
jgi:class 3 adenylate cyclase/tetratricopeptide (TPR) repeat protein